MVVKAYEIIPDVETTIKTIEDVYIENDEIPENYIKVKFNRDCSFTGYGIYQEYKKNGIYVVDDRILKPMKPFIQEVIDAKKKQ